MSTQSELPIVRVVGLGPGGPGLLTAQSLAVLAEANPLWLRTARHPAAEVVPNAPSFDELYEQFDTFDQVYGEIVERLVAQAIEHGTVTYAVPGSPAVAERTVESLLADDRVLVEQIPALSFLDLAWGRLGIDPLTHGVTVIDGHCFAEQVAGRSGPFLVAQCDQSWVMSEIKLAVDDPDDELRVVVVQRLGLPDESIVEMAWNELDRVDADHLTSLWIPQLPVPAAVAFGRFEQMVIQLRTECPWDAEQTHESLRKYLIEEAYEVLEAIDVVEATDSDAAWAELCEELGDVLYQVFFHAVLASEQGQFSVADVATTIYDKLWIRHPHVYGDESVDGTDNVVANWDRIKREEKAKKAAAAGAGTGDASVAPPSAFDGIPSAMPSLMFASKVARKLGSYGIDAELLTGSASLAEGENGAADVLIAAVNVARSAGVDAESALRDAVNRLVSRFKAVEAAAFAAGETVDGLSPERLREFWIQTDGTPGRAL